MFGRDLRYEVLFEFIVSASRVKKNVVGSFSKIAYDREAMKGNIRVTLMDYFIHSILAAYLSDTDEMSIANTHKDIL